MMIRSVAEWRDLIGNALHRKACGSPPSCDYANWQGCAAFREGISASDLTEAARTVLAALDGGQEGDMQ